MIPTYKKEIEYTSKKNLIPKVFITLPFGIWLTGLAFLISFHFNPGTHVLLIVFIFVFTVMWSALGFSLFDLWLWVMSGKEIIEVSDGKLSITKRVFLFKRKKVFDLAHVRNLNDSKIFGFKAALNGLPYLGFENGMIRFDYGMKTFRFGNGISRLSALKIISEFKESRLFSKSNFE
ncbi:MAG: hypothetical protein LAT67_12225 [Balneolales bacterium]|nr:hypothetical protein [Balneolales bacterium]